MGVVVVKQGRHPPQQRVHRQEEEEVEASDVQVVVIVDTCLVSRSVEECIY